MKLSDDGFFAASVAVADATFVSIPSDVIPHRLHQLVSSALTQEGLPYGLNKRLREDDGDLEDENSRQSDAPRLVNMETRYVTTHKQVSHLFKSSLSRTTD